MGRTALPIPRFPWQDFIGLVILTAFFAAIVFFMATRALGQCAGCGGAMSAPTPSQTVFEWRPSTIPGDENRYYLYRNNVQIGGWDSAHGYYRPLGSDGKWGAASPCVPDGLPLPNVATKSAKAPACRCDPCTCDKCLCESWRTQGVDATKLSLKEHECYSISGKCVPKVEAVNQLKIEDDSQRMWLVVIGPEGARKKVVDDLNSVPALANLKSKVRVWSAPPDHFSLLDRDTNQPMFETTGNPGIYVMSPAGEVLSYQDGYGGPEDLRRSDPDYKKPGPALPNLDVKNNHPLVWGLLIAAVGVVFTLSRKEK